MNAYKKGMILYQESRTESEILLLEFCMLPLLDRTCSRTVDARAKNVDALYKARIWKQVIVLCKFAPAIKT